MSSVEIDEDNFASIIRDYDDFIQSQIGNHLPFFSEVDPNLDNGESHSPDLDGTPTSVEFEHTFDTSLLTASIGSVELELSAEDAVGNEVHVEEEVKGAIDTMLDALGQVWDAIVGVLSEMAEAVKDAVEGI